MTDEPDDDAVRRLLADARHTEHMPADVSARMDDVLRGLAREDDDIAPVVTLPRHRRRAAAALLVAAAVIVVGGVSLASLQHRGDRPAETAGAASSAEDRGSALAGTKPDGPPGSAGSGAAPNAGQAPNDSSQQSRLENTPPVRVRTHHFAADVRRARRLLPTSVSPEPVRGARSCTNRSLGAGTRVPASYGGSRAVLVYRSPAGGSQVVDLYLCGDGSPVRTTTLPQQP
ncbi:MAG: hypothetical protein ACR2K3_13955 [Nocardioides sp.]